PEIRMARALSRDQESVVGFEGMIGESPAMLKLFALIQKVAPTTGTVLITGESGVGKELAARAVHRLSPRKSQPFLACDCSTLAPSLLESELFGHVKGSFSGAVSTKKGMFEVADQGALFLDELANISLETQGKLLRVLESRRVKKVGDTEERPVDIRLIAATNRDLLTMSKQGEFREDLYYRLNVVPIHIPPLRERTEDIPLLVGAFLERFRRDNPTAPHAFTSEAMNLLQGYSWPGNVRELRNAIERIAILCEAERVEVKHIPDELRSAVVPQGFGEPPVPQDWDTFKDFKKVVRESAVSDVERRFVEDALSRTQGNVSKAAELVGMQRTNLHALMAKYVIRAEDYQR
ncbi:sigma-54 dependent transcriptional regulator, partial [bacterium]|nr:sigma-54 dependent transcriptional regulator [bacterium]